MTFLASRFNLGYSYSAEATSVSEIVRVVYFFHSSALSTPWNEGQHIIVFHRHSNPSCMLNRLADLDFDLTSSNSFKLFWAPRLSILD